MADVVSRALRRGSAVFVSSVAVVVVATSLRPIGTESTWLAGLGRVVPLALVAAGMAQWFVGRTVGSVAATLAGLSWAGVTWGVASVTRSDPLTAVGLVVGPLLVPWLVLQVAGVPTAWRPHRAMLVVAVAFGGIGLTGIVRALVYDPLLDLNCGPFCGHSPVLLVANQGLASILGSVATITTVLVSGSVALAIIVRSIRQPPSGLRAAVPPVLVAASMAGLAVCRPGDRAHRRADHVRGSSLPRVPGVRVCRPGRCRPSRRMGPDLNPAQSGRGGSPARRTGRFARRRSDPQPCRR